MIDLITNLDMSAFHSLGGWDKMLARLEMEWIFITGRGYWDGHAEHTIPPCTGTERLRNTVIRERRSGSARFTERVEVWTRTQG